MWYRYLVTFKYFLPLEIAKLSLETKIGNKLKSCTFVLLGFRSISVCELSEEDSAFVEHQIC